MVRRVCCFQDCWQAHACVTVGLAFHQKKPIKAYEIVGSAFESSAQVTKNVLTVKELLAPLSRDEVGLVRCLGLNYADHAVCPIHFAPCAPLTPSGELVARGQSAKADVRELSAFWAAFGAEELIEYMQLPRAVLQAGDILDWSGSAHHHPEARPACREAPPGLRGRAYSCHRQSCEECVRG